MIDMIILGRQMEMFTTLIVIGIFLQKAGLISDTNIKSMSVFLTKLIIPCLMLTLMPNGGSAAGIVEMWPVAIAAISYISGMFFLAHLAAGFLSFTNRSMKQTHTLLCAAGNAGFFGVPLIAALLPGEAAACAVYTLIEAVFCWTLGPVILSSSAISPDDSYGKEYPDDSRPSLRSYAWWKNLFSPIIVCIFIGFFITMLNIHPSDNVVWNTLTEIGGTTKYFSCIYIGLCIGQTGLRSLLHEKKVFLTSLLKLVIFPLVLYLILSRIPAFTTDKVNMFIILGATPSAVSVPILVSLYNGDMKYATSGILINTMLSILTIPLVVSISQLL